MYDTVYYYGRHAIDVANNTGQFIRTKGPKYLNKTATYVEPYARPVIHVASRVYGDVDAYAREKGPVVMDKIEEYAPGTREWFKALPKKIVDTGDWLIEQIKYGFERTKAFGDRTVKASKKAYMAISRDISK